jgi:undecaprenyl-diphosphatase
VEVVRALDQGAQDVVTALRCPWLDAANVAATHLGDWPVVATATLAAVLVLLKQRRIRTGLIVAAAASAGFGLAEGIKYLVDRPRPNGLHLVELPPTPSFPSGHALESTAAYGTLALLAARRLRRRWPRIIVMAVGLAVPLLVGFSRIYLGVHYFTDALGGWAGGLALALLAFWADTRWGGE